MRTTASEQVTRHLQRLNDGDSAAAAELLPLVYDKLRELAQAHFRRERSDHTLQPTALVHEAYLRLVAQPASQWESRAHFLAVAAQAIRRILIDHARRRNALKRQAPTQITVEIASDAQPQQDFDLEVLDDALARLAQLNERQSRVVEMRFLAGMTVEEVAHVLGVSPGTVKGEWRLARAWLQRELDGGTTS